MNQIEDQLLHFIKGAGKNGFSKYIQESEDAAKLWCPFKKHKNNPGVFGLCYKQDPHVLYLVSVLKRYKITIDYIEDDPYLGDMINNPIEDLNDPSNVRDYIGFRKILDYVIKIISGEEQAINQKLQNLTCNECIRLDEAITCQEHNCFLASTIMSVTAIECRLHYFFEKANKKLYREMFQKATLGQIIKVFDEKEYLDKKYSKLKQLMSIKHKPLLNLLNNYRIISAHPKAEAIDYKTSKSVLNLAFVFLLDPDLSIKEQRLLKPC